jgi:hypothetical protein
VARGGIEPPTYRFSGVHALALYGSIETRRTQGGRSSVKVKGGSSSSLASRFLSAVLSYRPFSSKWVLPERGNIARSEAKDLILRYTVLNRERRLLVTLIGRPASSTDLDEMSGDARRQGRKDLPTYQCIRIS